MANAPQTGGPTPRSDTASSLGHTIGRLATLLKSGAVSPGDRAALRRMQPGQSPPLTWYQFAVVAGLDSPDSEPDWIAIVAGMALMSPEAHVPGRPFGTALATTGYSELRLERLLASEGQTQRLLLLRTARFLAAHRTGANWVQPAALLLAREHHRREAVRNQVATDFFHHPKP